MVSGDGLTDIDLTAFVAAHRAAGGMATMAVKQVDDPSHYGVVVHDDELRVHGFQEKPAGDEARSDLCNCGIYAFEPAIFDYVPPHQFVDWAKDVFPALLRDGVPFHVLAPRRLLERRGQHRAVPHQQLRRPAGQREARDTRARAAARGVGGRGYARSTRTCACRRPSCSAPAAWSRQAPNSWARSSSATAASSRAARVLDGVIHWDGVKAGRNSHVAGSILGRHVTIHHEAVVHEDAVIGDRSEVCAFALVPPQARVEPRSRVGAGGVAEPDASL